MAENARREFHDQEFADAAELVGDLVGGAAAARPRSYPDEEREGSST